jgi:hypothetical protein
VGPGVAVEDSAARSSALGRRLRHHTIIITHIIADPAAELMPMPALAPVDRPLATFWLMVAGISELLGLVGLIGVPEFPEAGRVEVGLIWLLVFPGLTMLLIIVEVVTTETVVVKNVVMVVLERMVDKIVVVADTEIQTVDVLVSCRSTTRPILWSLSESESKFGDEGIVAIRGLDAWGDWYFEGCTTI